MSINDYRLYKSKGHAAAAPKAQGSVDVSEVAESQAAETASPTAETVEEAAETVPTSANLKAEIYDYLLSQGHDEADLDGLTKAELLELV